MLRCSQAPARICSKVARAVVKEAGVEVVADPFEAGCGALLLELAELPDDRLGEGVADRVAVLGGVLEQPVEQFEQVQAYLFRIG